ncbi:MAG: preprotein translocase subunit YajC [Planctomycetota bacterium]
MNLTQDLFTTATLTVPGTPGGGGGATQPGAPAGGAGGQNGAPPPGGGLGMLFPILIAFMLFMIVTSFMSGRKEKKKRQEMLSTLRKHDRVQTIGGILGTVSEIRDNEVVLKVDENTRIHVVKSSVQTVLSSAGGSPADPEPVEPQAIGTSA